ncbi:MAG TPA: universal stress protein [bacterium]|nr:universal stress protein [bacterium]
MDQLKIEHILTPVDFLDMTGEVVNYATNLARIFGAKMTILHVVHVPPLAEASTWLEPVITPSVEQDMRLHLKAAAEAKLKELAGQCKDAGVETGFAVREGVPFAEIIALAEEQKADLIVMGSQGRRGLSHFLVGSVAERVVRRAHCNVLCIKPKPEDQGEK